MDTDEHRFLQGGERRGSEQEQTEGTEEAKGEMDKGIHTRFTCTGRSDKGTRKDFNHRWTRMNTDFYREEKGGDQNRSKRREQRRRKARWIRGFTRGSRVRAAQIRGP